MDSGAGHGAAHPCAMGLSTRHIAMHASYTCRLHALVVLRTAVVCTFLCLGRGVTAVGRLNPPYTRRGCKLESAMQLCIFVKKLPRIQMEEVEGILTA